MYLSLNYKIFWGLGSLVARSRFLDRRNPDLNPDSIEDPPYMWAWCTRNLVSKVKSSPISVAWKFERTFVRFRCASDHCLKGPQISLKSGFKTGH
ncbi:hypothetical protein AVEN_267732-1 [Araneus ventricosus]|uniref:Uncharacterized protein n=1 Tax=Araneus ventricosus TaxID=182803 RepID=A0A4Y2CVH2_ARAVE|nr:hypothetical protein AVEN_267732-1 [Araneus ventricosus]